jgi:hypothetical protein
LYVVRITFTHTKEDVFKCVPALPGICHPELWQLDLRPTRCTFWKGNRRGRSSHEDNSNSDPVAEGLGVRVKVRGEGKGEG